MKVERKPDSAAFKQQLDLLKSNTWLGTNRQKWIPYLFHFSDIKNIVSILSSGELLSRNFADKKPNFQDIASPSIIQQTDDSWKNYVRFYFRPLTPTLYHNEGFRPLTSRSLNSHCPVPIYLLFDFYSVVTRKDAQFTNGNLARSNVEIYSTASEFQKLPFESIYHASRFAPHERDTIIFHRHAEVLVPNRINLGALKYIWCRSQAEYEMLQHLLPPEIWQRWSPHIFESSRLNLFNRRWVYVKQATLTRERITFEFNPAAIDRDNGSFHARLTIIENETGNTLSWEDDKYYVRASQMFSLENVTHPQDYTVRFTLDGQLAYANRYQESDLPF